MATFEANGEIGQEVEFCPTFRQAQKMGIADGEPHTGRIVAVRFTEAKVWYDILCDYYGVIFDNVPSEKVTAPKVLQKVISEN